MRFQSLFIISLLLALFNGCYYPHYYIIPEDFEVTVESDTVVFAVIGDYGTENKASLAVAELVKSWQPDFIITTGDNNYQRGEYETLHSHIGQYYCDYIYNYDAPEEYRCAGLASQEKLNRFFPSPGNHDEAGVRRLEPYLNYFTLPGKEEYYQFTWGNAAFYSINSLSSADLQMQKEWLSSALGRSMNIFNIVYFHYPPYSPGNHGDTEYMQWDYYSMGVDVVLSGHDHIYARMQKQDEEDLHYIINGLGGRSIYNCSGERLDPGINLESCYNLDFGAMKCVVTPDQLSMAFYSIANSLVPVDSFEIFKSTGFN